MIRLMSSAAAVALALTLMGPAVAKPAAKAGKMTCPDCKMPVTTHRTKVNTVAIKMPNGKTLYCCAACPMGKKALAAKGGAKHSAKGAAKS